MTQATLFPLDNPLTPAADRTEPVVWLQRLVILPHLEAESPIREIPFRPGLNVINTASRGPDDTTVVGHSVGKTLLMRLIRYSLGETHFAVENTRNRMHEWVDSAYVVTHWRVDFVDKIVVRPLFENSLRKSFVVSGSNWREAIAGHETSEPHCDFVNAVATAVMGHADSLTLPKADRLITWLDILGWLARDFECGYRSPNQWRHQDADSGRVLDRDDCSLIMQWVAGLMSAEEIGLRQVHVKLLHDRKSLRADRETLGRQLNVLGEPLFRRIVNPTDAGSIPDREGLFASQSSVQAQETIASLGRLKEEQRTNANLTELQVKADQASEAWEQAKLSVLTIQGRITLVTGEQEQESQAGNRESYNLPQFLQHCRHPKCPRRKLIAESSTADSAKQHNIEQIDEEVAQLQKELTEAVKCRDQRKAIYDTAADQVQSAKDALDKQLADIDQSIGRWNVYAEDSEAYADTRAKLDKAERDITGLDSRIDQSYEDQKRVREKLLPRLASVSARYDAILKVVFGKSASGKITIDGNGLHPEPANTLSPTGAAMAIMTTVLGFDLSMLASSIEGTGHHPRFLLHDSPREGDMEEQLFHQLFEVAIQLESVFRSGIPPSFQYILTTTTACPPELLESHPDIIRDTFDARAPNDRLMRMAF